MCRCENLGHKEGWVPKNWCFQIVVLEKTVNPFFTTRRPEWSIPKQIHPEYSLEGLMLKLEYLGHLMQRADSLEKTLMLERLKAGEEGGRGWSNSITDSVDMNLSKLWEIGKDREAWRDSVCGVTKSWRWLSDWMASTIFLLLTSIKIILIAKCSTAFT